MADTYLTLAHFAQTWGLVLFCAGFGGVVLYALSPSRKKMFEDAASMPLREDD
jgi:cytochrome c oxidase cbb3-type subunit 4